MFAWFLVWWPHAISHGLNPFFTHLLWSPFGFNLAEATAIPGPSLLAMPLTLTAGPVVAFNVLAMLAPALSAWTAFLLCRHVIRSFWPSLLGGYLYGFSSYELGQMQGHLNLTLTFLLPVCVLLVLRRVEGTIGPRRFVLLLAATLLFQFLISPEVSVMLAVFGGVALVLALLLFPPPVRRRVSAAMGQIALAYVLAGLVLTPYLYYFFARHSTETPIYSFYPSYFSMDPLNLVVPTDVTLLGHGAVARLAATFTGNSSEQNAYLGLPVLAMVVLFGLSFWRTRVGRLLLLTLIIVCVAALGPVLHVAGTTTVPLPWRLLLHVPFLKFALPARFMLLASLIVALVVAMWVSTSRARPWFKGSLAVLAVVFLLPNLGSGYWRTGVDTPAFFTSGLYRRYLPADGNVLVIPYGSNGNSMLWQAQTGMYFRMPEGYLTVTPPRAFASVPLVDALYSGRPKDDFQAQLRSFLRATGVRTILVNQRAPGQWGKLFGSFGVAPASVGGVFVYRVPSAALGAP